MPRLPLTALSAFEAAARHASMSRAAKELGLTHGAVSRQVARLEGILGARLFERTPRGLVPTATGRALATAAGEALGRLSEAMAAASGVAGELRVAAPLSFAARWLAPRLGEFLARHPGARVRVEGGNAEPPEPAPPDLVAIRYVQDGREKGTVLSVEPLFPVCAPALLAGPSPLCGPEDLTRHVALHFRDAPDWQRWRAGAQWRYPGLPPQGAEGGLSFSDSVMVLEAAAAGQGVAIGRPSLVMDDLAAGRLVRPFGPDVEAGDRYLLVHPQANRGSRLARAFRDWLLARATEDREAFERLRPWAGCAGG